jgi:hypothetical protein
MTVLRLAGKLLGVLLLLCLPSQPPGVTVGSAHAAGPQSLPDGDRPFRVVNGTILSPTGASFQAKGINIYDKQLDCCAGLARRLFPGLNFVRIAVEHPGSAARLVPYVVSFTMAGIVVEIEDHSAPCCRRNIPTGGDLVNELDWYRSLSEIFKSNPYVWFGTMNEPDDPSRIANVARHERAIYDAIRGTGNKSPILLQCRGGWLADFALDNPGYFASMTNVVWEPHFYGWIVGESVDQRKVDAAVRRAETDWGLGGADVIQQVRSADGLVPLIIGEYGVSSRGSGPCDANYPQVLRAVQQSGFGSAAWAFNAGNETLVANGRRTNYGDEVAEWIRSGTSNSFASCP